MGACGAARERERRSDRVGKRNGMSPLRVFNHLRNMEMNMLGNVLSSLLPRQILVELNCYPY